MEVVLKRISKDAWDELMRSITSQFESTKNLIIDDLAVESASEDILINGETVRINVDVDKYKEIVDSDVYTYEKLADLGMLLRNDFKMKNGEALPSNIMNEKEVWAYFSLTIFKDIVKSLRMEDDDKINIDKIERFYFNTKTKSRTGLLFVWTMAEMLNSNERDFNITAFEFIDPVKAIYERAMSRNPIILKAFVQGIINNGCDKRLKNNKYRSKVPSHISCYSCVNILDVYSYDELVENITEQIKTILSL